MPKPVSVNIKIAVINKPIIEKNFEFCLIQFLNSPFFNGNFSNVFAAKTPAIVAQEDANNEVPIIIAGSELPEAALTAIAVTGINVIPAVFIGLFCLIVLVVQTRYLLTVEWKTLQELVPGL